VKLYAISDLHVGIPKNRRLIADIEPRPDDWLLLAGDVGETEAHLRFVFEVLRPRFRELVWVPGNHELWTQPQDPLQLYGEPRYDYLVQLCREYNVLTPEDPYPLFTGEGGPCFVVPLFILYDYSFRPDYVPRDQALEWAMASDVLCQDERFLYPDPYPTRESWCTARVEKTLARLLALPQDVPLVLVNHNPLHPALCVLPNIPRFTIWCGTMLTADWHQRFNVKVVVSGHLHLRTTREFEGTRWEEVSLGYPAQRLPFVSINRYVRQILPKPDLIADGRFRWYK
jgi:3',5'-cyclic AMP phosphodiesterase CpdA